MPIDWRLGGTRRAIFVASAVAITLVIGLAQHRDGRNAKSVSTRIENVGGTGVASEGAPSPPAYAANIPGVAGLVEKAAPTPQDLPGATESEQMVKVPAHAHSTGRNSVSIESRPAGGVVVTNSGSAVAHSGGNTEVSGGNGEVVGVESGDVNAEGNRSTTHVRP